MAKEQLTDQLGPLHELLEVELRAVLSTCIKRPEVMRLSNKTGIPEAASVLLVMG